MPLRLVFFTYRKSHDHVAYSACGVRGMINTPAKTKAHRMWRVFGVPKWHVHAHVPLWVRVLVLPVYSHVYK